MERVWNFSAGPAMLPLEVLGEAGEEMEAYGKSGMSVMEMSHRSKDYEEILDKAEADLRRLMDIPQEYKVLFLQGGASLQFAMVPMNLMRRGQADYIITGQWAKKAWQEAKLFGQAHKVAGSEEGNYAYIPDLTDLPLHTDGDYLHICSNNTIYGTRFSKLPDTQGLPLVADMSSCILSEPVDVRRYGLIYAGAQKNVGPAGVTIVILREDLLREDLDHVPTMLRYKTHIDNGSMYNTPPTYGIYLCGKVFSWVEKQGGLAAMEERNQKKAKVLYDFLNNSRLFSATVQGEHRSLMNIPFVTGSEDLDKKFLSGAKEAGLVNLKGYRSVGGMRASIYNAMPIEGVEALVAFMRDFEAKEGR